MDNFRSIRERLTAIRILVMVNSIEVSLTGVPQKSQLGTYFF